jgi:glucose/arabinose dehydrogenase
MSRLFKIVKRIHELKFVYALFCILGVTNCFGQNLSDLTLPDGFSIAVFAEVVNARSLAKSPAGTIFVSTRKEDKIYALQDTDKDGIADKKFIIASGLKTPNGVAFRNGDLYVAEVSRILKFSNIEAHLTNPPKATVVYDKLPKDRHHGWKYIAFGPDGKLYIPVGAPCNNCESENPVYAAISRMNADGSGFETIASGVRNTVGFTWHPQTKEMWFTDNGRDMLGDNYPACELNTFTKKGQHYGYPYCHGGDIGDPEFGSKFHCSEFEPPAWKFQAHTAPLGLKFYTGDMFPSSYQGDLIVAQHGSWNRSKKVGYKLMRVKLKDNKAVSSEVFVEGWMDDASQKVTGRPVDVLVLDDGSMLVSDDHAGKVYRITYKK